MTMLAEHVDGVIGVDTHRDTLAAAAVSPIGAVLETTDAPAHGRGYQRLLDFARSHVPGRRCWALEGTGSLGAGLAAFLADAGEQVIEVCRPKRPPVGDLSTHPARTGCGAKKIIKSGIGVS